MKGPKNMIGIVAPAECVSKVVTAYTDYLKDAQQHESERVRIREESSVAIARVQAWRDMLMHYLDRSFDERRENFDRLFKTLDEAVEKGQVEVVSQTLKGVVQLAESSPFQVLTLQDARRILSDPQAEIEI